MLFKNANIFVGGQFQHGSFRVENGRFAEILTTVPDEDGTDLQGRYVIPGLIDVHNHGNSGADFSDGDYDGLIKMARYLAQNGVTSFAPASMTLPYDLLDEWDAERNLPLTPQTVTYGSHKSAWWRCENGHEWKAAIYTRSDGARCPYCTGRKVMVGFNDLATQSPELARQWDYEKNVPLVPADISAGSHRSVWWRCEKGHSWRASIHSRASGCGCPVCAGRQILVGENDLATVDPELAQEWDTARNGKLTPQDVLPGTEKKVWWVCEHGHHWRAAVSARTNRQSGCPYCSGKLVLPGFNDLASQNPVLAAQWDTERNGTLTPQQVTLTSNRKAWWICEKGHSFQAVIASRAKGTGCPYCTNRKVLAGFNDLATVEPRIAAEWHPTLNGALTPEMVTVGSTKKVWWECPLGHVWKAAIYPRTGAKKCGCPVCAGKTGKEGNRS